MSLGGDSGAAVGTRGAKGVELDGEEGIRVSAASTASPPGIWDLSGARGLIYQHDAFVERGRLILINL